jgi:hypothetical protein
MANDITQLVSNPEMLGLERQRQMAQMLLKQGMQMPQGEMIGNRYVPTNPMQYIGNLFNVYAGQKGLEAADQQELALAKALREKKLAETTDIMQSLIGTPEQVTQLAGPAYQGVAPTATMPAVLGSPQEALAKALKSETGAGNMLLPSIIENVIPKKTQEIINFETAKKDGFKGTFNDYKNQMNEYQKEELKIQKQRLALEGANAGKGQVLETPQGAVLVDPRTGKVTPLNINGEPIMGKNPLNETQAKASLYQGTMLNSTKEMEALEKSGFNPSSFKNQASLSMGATATGNAMMPENAQRYKQASDAFANSYIRFQSGAGINQDEIQRNLKNMMPSLGDKPGQIEQKQRAREEAIRLMGAVAGPGNQLANKPQMPSMPKTNAPAAPATIDPALLQYMTPDQRKLFGG